MQIYIANINLHNDTDYQSKGSIEKMTLLVVNWIRINKSKNKWQCHQISSIESKHVCWPLNKSLTLLYESINASALVFFGIQQLICFVQLTQRKLNLHTSLLMYFTHLPFHESAYISI